MITVAAVAALVLVGCGRSAPTDTGGAAPGAPLKVMQIGTFDSPQLSLTDARAGVQAHVAAINAAGGVNGRQIEVDYCNDAFNASTGAACARKAVSDGVVAVVGPASSQAPTELPILEAAGIPWLGGAGSGGPVEATSPVSYPLHGGTQSMQVGAGRLLADKGARNVAVIVADAAAAYPAAEDVASGVAAGGGSSYRTLATVGAPDFSAVASAALAQRPDAVAVASTTTDTPRIILAVRQAGFTGNIATLANVLKADAQKSLGASGANVFVTSSLMPTTNTSDPAMAEFVKAMTATQPQANRDNSSLGGWAAVGFFRGIVDEIGSGPVTAATITAKLAALDKPISLGVVPDYKGIATPPPVAKYPRVPNFAVYVSALKDGALVQEGGTLEPYGKP